MLEGFARFLLGVVHNNRYLKILEKPESDFVVMLCRNNDYLVTVHRRYIDHILIGKDNMSPGKVDFAHALQEILSIMVEGTFINRNQFQLA